MIFLLVTQLVSTLFMVGLIWFVQIVHYPLFAKVGLDQFPEYERVHQRQTTWVVGPVMVTELGSALLLPFALPDQTATWLAYAGLALTICIWLSTWFLQVPAHHSLQVDGFSPAVHARLVRTNWVRTIAWSTRGVLVVYVTLLCLQ